MQVGKTVKLIIEGKSAEVKALFDTGSSFTITSYETLKELFTEVQPRKLAKTREAVLLNGQKVVIDSYVDSEIVINDYSIGEIVYLAKEMVREVMVGGIRVYLPELIIGHTTMEVWGIDLDLRKGEVIIRGGGFLL